QHRTDLCGQRTCTLRITVKLAPPQNGGAWHLEWNRPCVSGAPKFRPTALQFVNATRPFVKTHAAPPRVKGMPNGQEYSQNTCRADAKYSLGGHNTSQEIDRFSRSNPFTSSAWRCVSVLIRFRVSSPEICRRWRFGSRLRTEDRHLALRRKGPSRDSPDP